MLNKKSIIYLLIGLVLIFIVILLKNTFFTYKATIKKFAVSKIVEDFDIKDNFTDTGNGLTYKNNYGDLSFDKNGNLGEISQIEIVGSGKKSEKFKSVDDIKKMLSDRGYVDSSYEIYYESPFLDEGLEIFYVKKSKYGLKNRYNSIRVLIDRDLNLPVSYKRREEFTEDIEPKISQDEAVKIAQKFLKENVGNKEYKLSLVELRVEERNDWYGVGNIKDLGQLSIVYDVEFETECVYVDSLTGDIAGGASYDVKTE